MGDCALLYNANTGAVLQLSGADRLLLAGALSRLKATVSREQLPDDVYQHLIAGGFLLPAQTDEIAGIRERYWRARQETPMVLTLTTTLDCNLGCYYCYEGRSADRLAFTDIQTIVALADERLTRSGRGRLHVDWYGGEPLMNIAFMEDSASALQALCERLGVTYVASIISNGACWPQDVGEFLRRQRVRQVQISFDGLRSNHNRRRRYRPDYAPDEDASSFDRAASLVDKLLDHVRVDIRLNIDRANLGDVLPFINFARSRGWFERPFPAIIQPARLASYSERSSFMRKSELSAEEYEDIRALIRAEVGEYISVEEAEVPDGFPYPRTSVCAALAADSIVVGADRRLYRCGLQVSEHKRAVGQLRLSPKRELPVLNQSVSSETTDELWWQEFDPTAQPNCARCSFLPICWGGCAKKHLERDEHALHEQSLYWRRNLPRLIASGVGVEVDPQFAFTEADQFR